GEIGHPANADEVVAVGCSHDFGPFFNLADTENCQLRLVDDRRSEQAAEHAWVRDREGAAGHFVGFQLLGPGAVSKIICSACESGNAQIVSAFDYGNNQTPVECDGHPEIDVLLVNDLLAIYLCVE